MSTKTKRETVTLPEGQEAVELVWSKDGKRYRWQAEHQFSCDFASVFGVNIEQAGYKRNAWFAFTIADCFDPPIYVVCAESFEAAYEEFLDWKAEDSGIRIDDADLKDYPDGPPTYSSSGIPLDPDNVQGFELVLEFARFA